MVTTKSLCTMQKHQRWQDLGRIATTYHQITLLEIDDFCQWIHFQQAGGRFAHRAVEIKSR